MLACGAKRQTEEVGGEGGAWVTWHQRADQHRFISRAPEFQIAQASERGEKEASPFYAEMRISIRPHPLLWCSSHRDSINVRREILDHKGLFTTIINILNILISNVEKKNTKKTDRGQIRGHATAGGLNTSIVYKSDKLPDCSRSDLCSAGCCHLQLRSIL